MRMH
jgi:hypothetical protein